jgi:glc operon protein GlcG
MVLDQTGAQTVLQAAKEIAQQRNAPSAIAVVDRAGLLAFQRMDGVRPASADLAIQKARTAARLQRPTAGNRGQHQRGPYGIRHCQGSRRCAAACRCA